jgi:dipicolinate synthase subunit B
MEGCFVEQFDSSVVKERLTVNTEPETDSVHITMPVSADTSGSKRKKAIPDIRVGVVMTGSFCTFQKTFDAAQTLKEAGADLLPVMSFNAAGISTRFGRAEDNVRTLENICQKSVISKIETAEPIGPQKMTDILIIMPCTGNTLAKLAVGITDTAVVR